MVNSKTWAPYTRKAADEYEGSIPSLVTNRMSPDGKATVSEGQPSIGTRCSGFDSHLIL
jgi:hypothetical protein